MLGFTSGCSPAPVVLGTHIVIWGEAPSVDAFFQILCVFLSSASKVVLLQGVLTHSSGKGVSALASSIVFAETSTIASKVLAVSASSETTLAASSVVALAGARVGVTDTPGSIVLLAIGILKALGFLGAVGTKEGSGAAADSSGCIASTTIDASAPSTAPGILTEGSIAGWVVAGTDTRDLVAFSVDTVVVLGTKVLRLGLIYKVAGDTCVGWATEALAVLSTVSSIVAT